MIKHVARIGILAFALTVALVHTGNAAPVTLTVDGFAEFDPTPPHGLGALGVVSGQPLSLAVTFDDALIGNGVHEVSSATGIGLTVTLGPLATPVIFSETDDFCFDNLSCNAFLFVDIRDDQIYNVSYVGERTIAGRDYALVVYRDFAESPTMAGYFFDWILYDCTGTTNCFRDGISTAGGELAFAEISEPGTMGLMVVSGLALARLRRRRRSQA